MRRAYTHLIQAKPNFDNAFTFTVQTDDVGTSANNQFTLPIPLTANPMQIDWGDDTFQTGVTSSVTHTYPVAGLYTIKINKCNNFAFFNEGDKLKMRQVSQVGDFRITIFGGFYGCTNMTWTATDVPVIQTTDIRQMFQGCSNFNGNINNWDVSGVTNFGSLFNGASSFNQPLNSWDVSNAKQIVSFNGATLFNQPLNNWVFPNVTSLRGMFANTSFNQDITSWNVSNITNMSVMFLNTPFNQDISSWNVSNVTTIENMFSGASDFNQNISIWNVSKVTNMLSAFENATLFNQNLSSWNISINFSNGLRTFKNSGMSCINYTDTLVSWINQAKTNSGPLNVNVTGQTGMIYATSRSGGVNYATAGDARTNAIETVANGGLGWTISSDTVQANC